MLFVFTPFELKSITIPNRIVMPPMCMYSATEEGQVTDWHLIHYGSRAVGKVGLIILEATAVEKRGRLSGRDLGIWEDSQIEGLRRVVEICRAHGSVVGIQLAHAGRKAWGDELVAPSAIAFPGFAVPHALSRAEIAEVVESWRQAARRTREAGFDVLQIHAAHGYLIHEFLSPLSNQRTDEYGGSLENRMRFLLEIVEAVQTEWPADKPLSVRLSAVDYLEGGLTLKDTVEISKALQAKGVDLLDISSGGILSARIELGPGYQVRFAEVVKQATGLPTIAVGLITSVELAQEIISNGRADFVALGRELLRNPHWVLQAKPDPELWPKQYERAIPRP
ncbi:MAG: NADPH dehydrogenase NamA [Limnochordia bacterium]|nr:NADPH dehydrogenase NamA [Limnochordia bacterium]NLO96271.1 NADPH dehydrogenase NamA [Bacillota bacterium]HOB41313.1 NADPH dehydrogenase NamA [Limnochordia bacterium]HOK32457.1 NADPH dehydrogenase NamA [Limnochordia bacterium]HOM01033.1 NADPH dehydrogenase NamA [Limnochordia bacterium]